MSLDRVLDEISKKGYRIGNEIGRGRHRVAISAEKIEFGATSVSIPVTLLIDQPQGSTSIGAQINEYYAKHRNEITIHASQNHPNISQIMAHYDISNKQIVVINGNDGIPLSKKINESHWTKTHIVEDLATGLQYMHKNDTLHMDLTLDNAIDQHGTGKIIDFGNAAHASSLKKGPFFPRPSIARSPPELINTWISGAEGRYTKQHELYTFFLLSMMIDGGFSDPFPYAVKETVNGIHIPKFNTTVGLFVDGKQENQISIYDHEKFLDERLANIPWRLRETYRKALAFQPGTRFNSLDEFLNKRKEALEDASFVRRHLAPTTLIAATALLAVFVYFGFGPQHTMNKPTYFEATGLHEVFVDSSMIDDDYLQYSNINQEPVQISKSLVDEAYRLELEHEMPLGIMKAAMTAALIHELDKSNSLPTGILNKDLQQVGNRIYRLQGPATELYPEAQLMLATAHMNDCLAAHKGNLLESYERFFGDTEIARTATTIYSQSRL